jgi:hypothetical protein
VEADTEAVIGGAGQSFQDDEFEWWHYPIGLG